MDSKRAKTLDALAAFIAQQREVIARTQSDVHTLRELKAEAVARADVGALAVQLNGPAFRISERAADLRGPASTSELEIQKIDWALFAQKDPHPLQHLARAKRTAHAARTAFVPLPPLLPPPPPPPPSSASTSTSHNIIILPHTRTASGSTSASASTSHLPPQRSTSAITTSNSSESPKLSDLQSLVRAARQSILDPVFSALALHHHTPADGQDETMLPPSASSPHSPIQLKHAAKPRAKNACPGGGDANTAGPPRGPSGLFTRRASAAHKELQARQAQIQEDEEDGKTSGSGSGSSTAVECPSPPALVKGKEKEKGGRGRGMSDYGGKYARSTARIPSSNHPHVEEDRMALEELPLALAKPVRTRRVSTKLKERQETGAVFGVPASATMGVRRSSRVAPVPVPSASAPTLVSDAVEKRGAGRLGTRSQEEVVVAVAAPKGRVLRLKLPTRPPTPEEAEDEDMEDEESQSSEEEEESGDGSESESESESLSEQEESEDEQQTPAPASPAPAPPPSVLGKRRRRPSNAHEKEEEGQKRNKTESSIRIRINFGAGRGAITMAPAAGVGESVSAPVMGRTRTRDRERTRTTPTTPTQTISTRTRTRGSGGGALSVPVPVISTTTTPTPDATPTPTRTTSRASVKKKEKPKADTYKVMWSVEEQNQLETLLEQIPKEDPRRYLKISLAMEGRRTPRQVSSRVQKYLQKLRKFGVE